MGTHVRNHVSRLLVEIAHNDLLSVGWELLQERCWVGARGLQQDLGRRADTLGGLRSQGLGLEGLCDVHENLSWALADGRVLPGEYFISIVYGNK